MIKIKGLTNFVPSNSISEMKKKCIYESSKFEFLTISLLDENPELVLSRIYF